MNGKTIRLAAKLSAERLVEHVRHARSLWHATSCDNVESIKREGLKPRHKGVVFLSFFKDDGWGEALVPEYKQRCLVELDLDKCFPLQMRRFEVKDENGKKTPYPLWVGERAGALVTLRDRGELVRWLETLAEHVDEYDPGEYELFEVMRREAVPPEAIVEVHREGARRLGRVARALVLTAEHLWEPLISQVRGWFDDDFRVHSEGHDGFVVYGTPKHEKRPYTGTVRYEFRVDGDKLLAREQGGEWRNNRIIDLLTTYELIRPLSDPESLTSLDKAPWRDRDKWEPVSQRVMHPMG